MTQNHSANPATPETHGPLPLEAVLITDELQRRPTRVTDHDSEKHALTLLMEELARSPEHVLQSVAETALSLCCAHSAGISLIETQDGQPVFVWRALAGQWARFLGSTMPFASSPCGTVVERNTPMLMHRLERHYVAAVGIDPPIIEALLLPFHSAGRAVGTMWLLSHDEHCVFDTEHVRVLQSLARFAGAAWQVSTATATERSLRLQLQAKTEELERLSDSAAVGLTRCGADLRFRSVNRAYAELIGMPREAIVGRAMVEVLGEQAMAITRPYIDRVLQGEAFEYEHEIPLPQGPRWMHVHYTPDRDDHGQVMGWIASVIDVSARHRAEMLARRSAQHKDALYQLAYRLQSVASVQDVSEAAVQAIVDALQCDRASVLLFDEGGVMRFVGWRDLSADYRRATEGHSPWTADETDPQPLGIDDVAASDLSYWLRNTIASEGIAALAFIPLVLKGRLIGKFMTYWNTPHHFNEEECELGLAIARQLAFAIGRQQAEEQLRHNAAQLALITNTAPVFICYCDTNMRFHFVNRAYAERFGLTPEQCLNRRISDVLGDQAWESIRPQVERVLQGELVEFETTVPYATIGERFMHCAYAPQFDGTGRVVAFVAAITDITERKHVEQALLQSEELLKEADRRKDEFLAMLAHELRNPLAPIANAVQLLHLEETDSPVQRQARAIIDRQAGRLSRLVDDLLEVSRISTGRIQLHLEQVAIGGILERALETVRPLVDQHRHQLLAFIPSEPIWLHADAARLEQVFVNLLNNAAKYTDEGGRIELSVTAADGQAVVRIMDNGIGIEPELLPRVFDLFTQAERALDRSQGGLGIGLSLVHRLVVMHGGRVEVHSTVSEGSEFIVHLPTLAVAGGTQSLAQITGGTEAAQPLRVLIVDDNVDAATTLAMLLEASGHEVATAHTGPEALTAAATQQPDVIFLDIGLPELDGYEVARRLRQSQNEDSLVIIAMTGYGQETDRARSRDVGFDHHLVKPVDIAVIQDILVTATAQVTAARG